MLRVVAFGRSVIQDPSLTAQLLVTDMVRTTYSWAMLQPFSGSTSVSPPSPPKLEPCTLSPGRLMDWPLSCRPPVMATPPALVARTMIDAHADRVVLQHVHGAVVERSPVGGVAGRVGRTVQWPPERAAVVADEDVGLAVVLTDRDRVLVGVRGLVQSPVCLLGSMLQHANPKFQYGPGVVHVVPALVVSKTSSRPRYTCFGSLGSTWRNWLYQDWMPGM